MKKRGFPFHGSSLTFKIFSYDINGPDGKVIASSSAYALNDFEIESKYLKVGWDFTGRVPVGDWVLLLKAALVCVIASTSNWI